MSPKAAGFLERSWVRTSTAARVRRSLRWTVLARYCPLLWLATSHALAQGVDDCITVPAPSRADMAQWWVDTDPAGNGATTIGTIQRCCRISTNQFIVDVVAFNVSGLGGFQYSLYFDPRYVQFVTGDNGYLLTSHGGQVVVSQAMLAGSNVVSVVALLNWTIPNTAASGSGVLTRFTFQKSDPEGQSGFDVDTNSALIAFGGGPIPSDLKQAKAQVVIDSTRTVGCWTVNSTDDDPDLVAGDGICDADSTLGIVKSTLRAAIQEANAFPGANRVSFRIPDAGMAGGPPWTIQPGSELPALSDASGGTEIDGTTQAGVVLSGTRALNANGFSLLSANNKIQGLSIILFTKAGVSIEDLNATGNIIRHNNIGLDHLGRGPNPNTPGVWILNAPNNTIGGPLAGDGNYISGNNRTGVRIEGGTATGNLVQGNWIGLAAGQVLGNEGDGVFILNAPNNQIGGATANPGAPPGNFISGNYDSGVHITGTNALNNLVEGNVIGLDTTAAARAPNANGAGVWIEGAPTNQVGGLVVGARNLISANGNEGVRISGNAACGNVVENNIIGSNGAGAAGLGNSGDGVRVQDAPCNVVGGPGPVQRNFISGNTNNGVHIAGVNAATNLVQGNYVGLNTVGNGLPNGTNGVFIEDAPNNVIGGTVNGARNLISANGKDGVNISGTNATGNILYNNVIGTDNASTAGLGNHGDGVELQGAPGNSIGGGSPGQRNFISGNTNNGVHIVGVNAATNLVKGNFIGTDLPGGAALGNRLDGVLITNAPYNLIGGSLAANEGNLISGNTSNGVHIAGTSAMDNSATANAVGLDKNGLQALAAAPIANGQHGVWIDGAPTNSIGGATLDLANAISGNTVNGVLISKAAATANLVQGNFIGDDRVFSAVANGLNGVAIQDASSNTIGRATAQPGQPPGNVISDNGAPNLKTGSGIELVRSAGQECHNNAIQGNVLDLNGADGVRVLDADQTFIGGLDPRAGNVIIRNTLDGISLTGAIGPDHTTIQNNFIGTNPSGQAMLGNGSDGIYMEGGSFCTIGGIGVGNVISDNGLRGILITGLSPAGNFLGAAANTIAGNNIGTTPNGLGALGNQSDGVVLTGGAQNNEIGGSVAGQGNLISGNASNNVMIEAALSQNNSVQRNLIGPNRTRTMSLAPSNSLSGVRLRAGATSTMVQDNMIEGNGGDGVTLEGASFNQVLRNVIGSASLRNQGNGVALATFVISNLAIAASHDNLLSQNSIANNLQDGIHLAGSTNQPCTNNLLTANTVLGNHGYGVSLLPRAEQNIIGGVIPAAANVISGNFQEGVALLGVASNTVEGNLIGLDPSGSLASPNGFALDPRAGVLVTGPQNSIGPGNVLSGNSGPGIAITGGNATNNLVFGDLIGLNAAGTAALGNSGGGVVISNAPANTIGGTNSSAANIVAGNSNHGIAIAGTFATNNAIVGNRVGTASDGLTARPNMGHGIYLAGASNTRIGGLGGGTANTIALNGGTGVFIAAGDNNGILGNAIFGNGAGGIHLAPPNANHLQNYPTLSSAISNNSALTIRGQLLSAPNTSFRLEFFSNPSCDPSGHGQGRFFMGALTAMTGSNGAANFAFGAPIPTGSVITATTTDPANNTSEFSACIATMAPATISATVTLTNGNVVLSWPRSADGYGVQQTHNLSPPIQWLSVTNAPVTVGDQLVLVLPFPADNMFFRLEYMP